MSAPRMSSPPPDETIASASRERILEASLAEFAAHGFAGARVDAIADRAGINKRMLYAYIGHKKDLWLAALERVYEHKRAEERKLDLTELPPPSAMAVLVRFNFRYHVEHPEFLAMLNGENLLKAGRLRESERVAALYSPLIELIAQVLAKGQNSGEFRANIDPVQLYISIISLGYFYCSNKYTLSAIFRRDFGRVDELILREQHAVDVIIGYLRPV